ncbi:MAG: BatD family protein [Bacteroidota bacterium]
MTAQVSYIDVSFKKDTALIGDYLQLHINGLYKGGEIFFPVLKDSIGNGFEVIGKSNEQIKDTSAYKKKTIDYTLIQFDAGRYEFAPLPILYKNTAGNIDTLHTNPFTIQISTIPVDTLKEIKPAKAYYIPPYQFKEFLPIIISIILISLVIAAIIYWWMKYKKKSIPQEPITAESIYENTIKQLNLLKSQKLWTINQTKEHHLKLSELIRNYIEYRYGMLALESTTDELITAMNSEKSISKEVLHILNELLKHCDLVKFAKWKPTEEAIEENLSQAFQFMYMTKPSQIQKEPKKND